MSKCFDHKTTFPDTHRHFHLATEISRNCSIVCKGAELKNSNKRKTCLDTQPMNDFFFEFWRKKTPCVKNGGSWMHNSELSLHLNCALDNPWCFTQGVQHIIFVCNIVYTYTCVYIYIYTCIWFIYIYIIDK